MARWVAAGVSALALGLAAWLSVHHPLAPWAVLALACLAAVFTALDPVRWPIWALPLLPVIGLMPWTGWLVVEELDILLLSVAAGAYARLALLPMAQAPSPSAPSLHVGWLMPMFLSAMVSAWIGVADAGGLSWGWWQGYREPLNSIRLLKPALFTLLFLPLLWGASAQSSAAWTKALLMGMVGLLIAVAHSVFWERWAYTGLADFSSDYRATALFWEMHVGGAALDAALVMSLPFAALALARSRSTSAWLAAAAALGLGAYAALATFSRIVYLAAPLAVLLTLWLTYRQARLATPYPAADDHRAGQAPEQAGPLLFCLCATVPLAAWLFPAGGYRSLLALLGAAVMLLATAELTRPLRARTWGVGLAAGGLLTLAVTAVSAWVPKGAYLAYGLTWLACAAAVLHARHAGRDGGAPLVASFAALLAALVAVGVHWGGKVAWLPGLGASGVLAAVWLGAAARSRPTWPQSNRWQAQAALVMVVAALVVGVFGGGKYMTQRFAQTSDDRAWREVHWGRSIGWLRGSEWLAGKGLGRYAANYSLSGSTEDQVGDYRLVEGPDGRSRSLLQTAGMHPEGGWFRVAQRVGEPSAGSLKLTLDILAQEPTEISVEICEKHLLYPVGCIDTMQSVARPGPQWQSMTLPLNGVAPTAGSWWAPRWIVFSVSLVTPGSRALLDNVDLRDAAGRSLLANGDFEQGMARWFTTSDRNHLPRHAKNLFVHLLFEQGLLGVVTWALAVTVALWRTAVGTARSNPLAPALAGALVGVVTVGLVDSLLDMPRVGWLMWLLLALALSLPAKRGVWQ